MFGNGKRGNRDVSRTENSTRFKSCNKGEASRKVDQKSQIAQSRHVWLSQLNLTTEVEDVEDAVNALIGPGLKSVSLAKSKRYAGRRFAFVTLERSDQAQKLVELSHLHLLTIKNTIVEAKQVESDPTEKKKPITKKNVTQPEDNDDDDDEEKKNNEVERSTPAFDIINDLNLVQLAYAEWEIEKEVGVKLEKENAKLGMDKLFSLLLARRYGLDTKKNNDAESIAETGLFLIEESFGLTTPTLRELIGLLGIRDINRPQTQHEAQLMHLRLSSELVEMIVDGEHNVGRCPVCLMTYRLKSFRIIFPCGHATCNKCIQRLRECALCRGPVNRTSPLHM